MKFTPKQKAALERMGQDVCVVAGPGSGKTAVLVGRFAWLVSEQKVSPLRILAITFTEKAASQIKTRLAGQFAGEPELRRQVERAYVSTVHGFCTRLLREYAIEAGVDPEFTVLDETESRRALEEAALEALESLYQARPAEFRSLLEGLHVSAREGAGRPDLARALCEIYDAARAAGLSVLDLRARTGQAATGGLSLAQFLDELNGILAGAPAKLTPLQRQAIEQLRAWAAEAKALAGAPVSLEHFELLSRYPRALPSKVLSPDLRILRDERKPLLLSTLAGEFYAPLKALLLEALERMDALYRRRKSERSALDFADLEERAIELLRRGGRAAAAIRAGFDHILMDELQDTNPLQWRLVNLLRRPERFFAVGDINQSIYGFRHAEPEVFERFQRGLQDEGRIIDELDENFRSRAKILRFAEFLTGGLEGIHSRELKAQREFLEKEVPSIEVIAAFGSSGARPEEVEAAWIARRIGELAGSLTIHPKDVPPRPLRFRDIAVLVRTVNVLPPIQKAFQSYGVPYLTEGGRTFYETREVRDLILLLKCIADIGDEIALAGVLRSPLCGLSDESLLRIKAGQGRLSPVLYEAGGGAELLPEEEERERLKRFAGLMQRLRRRRDEVSPERLLIEAIDATDYETGLSGRQRANIVKLLAQLREWHAAEPAPLEEVVARLDYLRETAGEAEAPPDDSSDAVRVMTIHKAKGLEFPVVFLAALNRTTGGNEPVIRWSETAGLGISWRDPETADGVKDLAYRQAAEERKRREEAEEHRLFYVAMTRAEEHLVLSFARTDKPQGTGYDLLVKRLKLDIDNPADNKVQVIEAGEPQRVAVRLLRTDQIPGPAELPAVAAAAEPEALVVERPVVPEQHETSAAVTSVQIFAQCPRRYYLGRYLGWDRLGRPTPQPAVDAPAAWEDREGLDAAEFGTLVHDLLAGKPVDSPPAEALRMVRRFQQSPLGLRAARASRLEREFSFLMSVEDVVLHGQIDLWFEEGGELILIDYKTIEADDYAARYAVQLRLYALALEQLTGRRPDQALIYLLRSGTAVPVSLSQEDIHAACETVRRFRQAQSSLEFEMKVSEACVECPFYSGLCPARIEG